MRAALTETCNVYPLPDSLDGLDFEAIRKANVDHHIDLMGEAHRQGVQVICFGELFTAPYFALGKDPRWIPMAEDAENGPTATQLKEAARRYKMIVIAPIYELDSDQGKRYNTALVIDEEGRFLGRYRKSHIPWGRNEQGEFAENFYYGRSDASPQNVPANISKDPLFPVFRTSVGNIGVSICYDRHFPYVSWSLAQQGAQIIFSPAITFGSKSQRMWHDEFPVDAARHWVFIGGSNRRGSEPPWNQPFFGESYFVSPNGLLENLSDHPNLVIADVDLEMLDRPDPSGWDLARDTRPDWLLQAVSP